jgi:hypothetical protein
MPEKTSQNPNTNNQNILEQITAQIAGENDKLKEKVNDALKKSLVPLLEKGIQEAVGMIPNISVPAPAPTPPPTQQQPQTQQQQPTSGGGEAGGEEAGGEEAEGEEAEGEEAEGEDGDEKDGEDGDEKDGEDGDEKDGEDGDEKDGDEKDGEKKEGEKEGEPGSPEVPGGQLPKDQAEGAEKASRNPEEMMATELERQKQQERQGGRQEEGGEKPPKRKKKEKEIENKKKEIKKTKNKLERLQFSLFTEALALALMLDIAGFIALILDSAFGLGLLVQYPANILFGFPLAVVLFVTTQKLSNQSRVKKMITFIKSLTVMIEMVPVIAALPSATFMVFRIRKQLRKAQKEVKKVLKRQEKELKQL